MAMAMALAAMALVGMALVQRRSPAAEPTGGVSGGAQRPAAEPGVQRRSPAASGYIITGLYTTFKCIKHQNRKSWDNTFHQHALIICQRSQKFFNKITFLKNCVYC